MARLRTENRGTVLAAGAVVAALVLVPVLNLITPIFGAALMVHLHKKLTRNPARPLPPRRDDAVPIGRV